MVWQDKYARSIYNISEKWNEHVWHVNITYQANQCINKNNIMQCK